MGGRVVYLSAGPFLCGVACASLVSVGVYTVCAVFVVGSALGVVGCVLNRDQAMFIGALVCVCCALGMGRFVVADVMHKDVLGDAIGASVTILGVVAEEVDSRDDWKWVTIEPREVFVYGESVEADTFSRVRIATEHFPEVSYGDVLRVSGDLEQPENFDTETGRTFNYVGYLAKDDVRYLMWFPEITVQSTKEGNIVVASLFRVKTVFKERINSLIPEPQAALANGIVLGTKQALGDVWEERFRNTGIIHIVVLSGFNVMIVAVFIMWMLGWLPIQARRITAMVAIGLFAVLVGLGATVVRASLMAGLALFAPLIHRRYSIHRALVVAAVAMVAVNPYVLVFDPSFQLSFIATCGLIYIGPLIQRGLTFLPDYAFIREVLVATISAQIAVTPMLLYMMGTMSLVALPVNALVLPVIPLAMLLVFMTGVAGFMLAPFASLVAYPTYMLLNYVFVVVEWFARLPFATVSVPPFPFVLTMATYALMVCGCVWWWRKYEPEVHVFNTSL